eukprot:Opistho-1_new@64395
MAPRVPGAAERGFPMPAKQAVNDPFPQQSAHPSLTRSDAERQLTVTAASSTAGVEESPAYRFAMQENALMQLREAQWRRLRDTRQPASFEDLPTLIVFVHIVPYLSDADVRSLSRVNRMLRSLLTLKRVFTLAPVAARSFATLARFRATILRAFPPWALDVSVDGLHDDRDLKRLRYLHSVTLTHCRARELPRMSSVETLTIRDSPWVVDLSRLNGVRNLVLDKCPGITSVRGLDNVHSIVLNRCEGVRDVTPLASAHSVTLANCALSNLNGVDALGSVHTLAFRACNVDGHTFASLDVHSLSFDECRGELMFEDVRNIHTLEISRMVAPIGFLRPLSQRAVVDLAPVVCVRTLVVKDSTVKNLSALTLLRTLKIENSQYDPMYSALI